jgi:hypothetical protein
MAKAHLILPDFTTQEIERFRSRFNPAGQHECWPWLSYGDFDGYGLFKARRVVWKATRIAYRLATGCDPGEFNVCHHCDNPPCVNPAHLFLGTEADNAADCMRKRLLNTPAGPRHRSRTRPESIARGDGHWSRIRPDECSRGEGNGAAKFTEELVRALRGEHAAGGISISALARRHGVCHEAMRKMIRRVTWGHVH